MKTRGARSVADNSTHDISDNRADKQNENGYDQLRQVAEDDLLEEACDLSKTENIEGGNQEHDNDKVFDDLADKFARIQCQPGFLNDHFKSGLAQSMVEFYCPDKLLNGLADNDADAPADKHNNDGHDQIRNEHDYSGPQSLKGALKNLAPCL